MCIFKRNKPDNAAQQKCQCCQTRNAEPNKALCKDCETFINLRPSGTITEWDFNVYKLFFDVSVKSRDDRASYSKYFLNLLFAEALVAILIAIIGASEFNKTGVANILFIIVFSAGAVISFAWALKLWTLAKIINAQQKTLKDLESELKISERTARFWRHLDLLTYKSPHWKNVHKGLCYTNYYILPIALCVFFAILAIFYFTQWHPIALPSWG